MFLLAAGRPIAIRRNASQRSDDFASFFHLVNWTYPTAPSVLDISFVLRQGHYIQCRDPTSWTTWAMPYVSPDFTVRTVIEKNEGRKINENLRKGTSVFEITSEC